MTKPEDKAREDIDRQLVAAGWLVQNRREANLHAGRGIAVREFLLMPGHGSADYLLYVDGKAAGVVEAKPAGARRLQFQDIQALANAIEAPPRSWTPELLWRSYETLDRDRVRGAAGVRLLTDIVSLVRFALHRDEVLAPFRDVVEERFETWLARQESIGRRFSEEQRQWLALIRDHVAASLQIDMDDFDFTPFVQRGGAGKAAQVFGGDLASLLEDLNQIAAA